MGLDTDAETVRARLERWLRQQPAWAIVVLALCLVGLLGVLDYLTGAEIAFSVFYLLPVMTVAWLAGLRAAWPVVLASGLTWLAADLAADRTYTHAWIPYWNTTTRLVVFVIVALLVADLRRALAGAEQLAASDGLTGVANSRTFLDAAERERIRAERYQRPFTLVYIDLDNFKDINDSYGHSKGDEVLRALARSLRQRARSSDVVARLGGDEFAVILPETDYEQAAAYLAELRPLLARELQAIGVGTTCSVGAVTFRQVPASADEMIHLADERMYDAKRAGKDAVCHVLVDLEPVATLL